MAAIDTSRQPGVTEKPTAAPVWPSSRRFRDASPGEKLTYLAHLRDDPVLHLFDEPVIPGLARGRGYWALTRHADVVEASRRPADFYSGQGALWINDIGPELGEFIGSITSLDDPRHSQLRKLVVAAFTPRTMRRLHDNLDQTAAVVVAAAARRRDIDVVADLAAPYPFTVICDLVGIPEGHRADVLAASEILVSGGDPEMVPDQQDPVRSFLDAANTLAALATDLAEHRRDRPADDLLTALVEAEVDGARLTTPEIASFFILLTLAGLETTRNATSLGFWARHHSPHARQAWATDFDRLSPTAIEEILRYTSPVILLRRTVARDTTLNGHGLSAGDKVVLFYAGANHDERVFTNPDQLDLTRVPNPHIAFGGPGPHYCLGAHLARAELTALFREIFRQLPDLTPTAEPDYLRSPTFNGVKRLPATTRKRGRR